MKKGWTGPGLAKFRSSNNVQKSIAIGPEEFKAPTKHKNENRKRKKHIADVSPIDPVSGPLFWLIIC